MDEIDVWYELHELIKKKDLDNFDWYYSGYTLEQQEIIKEFEEKYQSIYGFCPSTFEIEESMLYLLDDDLTEEEKELSEIAIKMNDFFYGVNRSQEYTNDLVEKYKPLLLGYLEVANPKVPIKELEKAIEEFKEDWD